MLSTELCCEVPSGVLHRLVPSQAKGCVTCACSLLVSGRDDCAAERLLQECLPVIVPADASGAAGLLSRTLGSLMAVRSATVQSEVHA